MIVFYYQTKTLTSFQYRRKLNPKFLIQLSETLSVELTGNPPPHTRAHTILIFFVHNNGPVHTELFANCLQDFFKFSLLFIFFRNTPTHTVLFFVCTIMVQFIRNCLPIVYKIFLSLAFYLSFLETPTQDKLQSTLEIDLQLLYLSLIIRK